MKRRRRLLEAVLASVGAVSLAAAPAVEGGESDRQRLADRYAPIMMLRAQEHPPCDNHEEQFEPTTVNVVLGNPRVKLMREGQQGVREVTTAPTADDIAGLGPRYYLDLPGNPLNPQCTYARDFAAIKSADDPPLLTYARIATEPGEKELVLQYWFFYYFNVFNDLHESDWEGMQIAFDAGNAREALATDPAEIVLYQHAGGERASWDDAKVQKEGNHPVVHAAAGSHATFYDSAVYVENGQHGSGLGCDNTTEPLREARPRALLVPTNPQPDGGRRWLSFEGRWGQKEAGYNNGPTGPITKAQWKEPVTWMAGVRSTSPQLPGGFVLGPSVTGAFCGAVAGLSGLMNFAAETTAGAVAVVAGLLLLLIVPAVLTRWRPVELTPLRQRRAFGQLIRAARQLYGRHWRVLVPIGLSAIPVLGAVKGLEWLALELTGGGQFGTGVSNTVGSVAEPIGFAVVAAVVVAFVRGLERGQSPGFVAAYRWMLDRFWRVVLAQLAASLLVFALALTVVGIPIAIWAYVAWQFVQQEILFEDKSIREAFRGSARLVRGHWWETVRVAGFLWLLSVVAGPMLGFALIFTALPLVWINALGSLVFALLVPFVAIGRTLLYFDLAVREQEAAAESQRRTRWWSRSRPSPQPG
jgi:hypothetical protein